MQLQTSDSQSVHPAPYWWVSRVYMWGRHYPPRNVLAEAILGSVWALLGGIVGPHVLK